MNYDHLVPDNVVDYGPSPDAKAWQRGGVGDRDWEVKNCQLLFEWLRFYDRMVENVAEQCARHGVTQAPAGWRDAQKSKFRRLMAKHYDGQVYPAGAYMVLHIQRVTERHGADVARALDEKWRQAR